MNSIPLTTSPSTSAQAAHRAHVVQLYEGDAFLVDEMTRFIGAGLAGGDPAVVIATEPHRRALEHGLRARNMMPPAGRYVGLDAAEVLSEFMIGDEPDADRFNDVVGGLIGRMGRDGQTSVRAFGEMVALLWHGGLRDAALRLEELWQRLAERHPIVLLCAYPIGAFSDHESGEYLAHICAAHTGVAPAESYSALARQDERTREIAILQHKARVLEAEVLQRRAAEEALRERNAAERHARAEAEAASRAKDEFLAMLGHELRNPLGAVRNALVTARLDPARGDRALEIASRGADQLARLVDDLLDVARITHGRIALRTAPIRVATVVARAVDAARPLIDERGHVVTVQIDAADALVDGDATRLEQVAANLVTNAAKFMEPGGRISVSIACEDGEVVLRVRDGGIGIAPEMLPRVFDLFAQAESTLARVQGGLGIGLTIVRRLVEMHGGRVEAHSDGIGTGAEFVVRLPLAVAREQSAQARPLDGGRTPGVRVLVVEDNVDNADSLVELLEVFGHSVRAANDGPRALELARADAPDVMLVDIGLPGMDGYEVARAARRMTRLRRTRLIALTGYGRDEDRQRALDAGFDDHLVKPVDPDALQRLVAPPPVRSLCAVN